MDGGLRPRVLGDEGGDVVALPGDGVAALRGLASERRRPRREAGVTAATAGAFTLSALSLSPSLSCTERGAWTRTRGRPRPRLGVGVGVDVDIPAANISALGFAFARALPLPLLFGPSEPTPRAISAMPVSPVPSEPPSSSSPPASTGGGRARLARPLVLALAPALVVGIRARMLWQFSRRQETSLSSACVASARNRARLASVCDAAQK